MVAFIEDGEGRRENTEKVVGFKRTQKKVKIVADRLSNAIYVSASPKQVQKGKRLR